ncbi:hypothetical protein [Lactococcus kimchii]|uniref:hypothetical protein n=1 Tax=Lactococcus sp. S-13 TaxID=2507158 RepID=UPI00102301C7|nr:hypothetical protein [Lactococcus sp. S-13]RZI48526.1 hypothetical protein EQJ87_03140 [Lactococcus sp. S-13]
MRHRNMEIQKIPAQPLAKALTKPQMETAVMKLVVDSYLYGAQTCEVCDGKILGVSIHHGAYDSIHLFINDHHKVTVEVSQGMSRITVMKEKNIEDIDYILPFTKCLGISEGQVLENYSNK